MRAEAAREQQTKDFGQWNAWDEFLESKTNSGFRQSSWYTAVKAARGWKQFGTVLRDGKAIVGGAMVLARSFAPDKCYYYIPDGPVFLEGDSNDEQEQVFRTIMEFIEANRQNEQQVVSHLCIDPRWERVPNFVSG